eukprot:Skav218981  [mRNA]  locus=scaffold1532:391436:392954:- [translate_table: standard]
MPLGLPGRWQNQQSTLRRAVAASTKANRPKAAPPAVPVLLICNLTDSSTSSCIRGPMADFNDILNWSTGALMASKLL